jgi:predicted lipoprotein
LVHSTIATTELATIAPRPFDPTATAQDLYTRAQAEVPGRAADLGKVVPAIQSDPKSAADTYQAVSPNENAYVFAVKATGTVVEATDASLRIKVDGVPDQTPVLVPLTTAVNGSVLRDAMGFKFADAPGQTQYQYVADELKKLMLADLQSSVADPKSLQGKQVDVVGVVSVTTTSGAPVPRAKPVNVQPVSVKAA